VAEGEGILGPGSDQGPPAPFAMLPDPFGGFAHTMRNPAHRTHTLGFHREHFKGVMSGADAIAARKAAT